MYFDFFHVEKKWSTTTTTYLDSTMVCPLNTDPDHVLLHYMVRIPYMYVTVVADTYGLITDLRQLLKHFWIRWRILGWRTGHSSQHYTLQYVLVDYYNRGKHMAAEPAERQKLSFDFWKSIF